MRFVDSESRHRKNIFLGNKTEAATRKAPATKSFISIAPGFRFTILDFLASGILLIFSEQSFSRIPLAKLSWWLFSEAVLRRRSVKKVFLEISQISQENTCARVSFLIKFQATPFCDKTPPVAGSVFCKGNVRTVILFRFNFINTSFNRDIQVLGAIFIFDYPSFIISITILSYYRDYYIIKKYHSKDFW